MPTLPRMLEVFLAEKCFYIPPAKSFLPPPLLNPEYDAKIDAAIDEWCMEFLDLVPGSEKTRYIRESKLGFLAAYVYPNMPYEKILPVAKFFAWIFLADDILDSPNISVSEKKNVRTVYRLILKGKPEKAATTIQSQELLRQARMFSEVLEELLVHMDESVSFIDAMMEVLDMFAVETSWEHKKVIPNTATYLWLREISVAIKPCFCMMNCIQHLGVGKQHLDHPLIQNLEKIASRHISLINDILSFAKEWQSGNYLNIVPILAHDYKISLNEAILKATSMIENLEKEFLETKQDILINDNGLSMKEGVREYINGIEAWITGNVEWEWMSARYHGVGWVVPSEKSITFTLE